MNRHIEQFKHNVVRLTRSFTRLAALHPTSYPTPDQMRNIFDTFHSKSGATFFYDPNEPDKGFQIHVPLPEDDMLSDDQIIHWATNDFSYPEDSFSGNERERNIREAREFHAKRYLGGGGITYRNLNEIEKDLPPLTDLLTSTKGKIVWLGNGFSDAPLTVFRQQKLKAKNAKVEPQIIVDVFDYELMLEDLLVLKRRYDTYHASFPWKYAIPILNQIVEAKRKGEITTVQYYVGSNKIPPELLNAELVINKHGPKLRTLDEQLSLLKPDGRLIISDNITDSDVDDSYIIEPKKEKERNMRYTVIRKKQQTVI